MFDSRMLVSGRFQRLFSDSDKISCSCGISQKARLLSLKGLKLGLFRNQFPCNLFGLCDMVPMAFGRPLLLTFKATDTFEQSVAIAGKLPGSFSESLPCSSVLQKLASALLQLSFNGFDISDLSGKKALGLEQNQ